MSEHEESRTVTLSDHEIGLLRTARGLDHVPTDDLDLVIEGLAPAVETIIRQRGARVRALADQWNDTPDYTPSVYDQGRVDQRHDMTQQLLEALGY